MMPYTTDRVELKLRAKNAMKKAAPNIFLVAFVCLLLTNAPTFVTEGPTLRLMLKADSLEEMMYIYENGGVSGGFLLSLATLAMSIFLNLVTCGWQLYTLRASREEETGGLETLFACFQQFWRFFSAILLMGLFTFLWCLLFIIPGIIAAYSYSQTIFIKVNLGTNRNGSNQQKYAKKDEPAHQDSSATGSSGISMGSPKEILSMGGSSSREERPKVRRKSGVVLY